MLTRCHLESSILENVEFQNQIKETEKFKIVWMKQNYPQASANETTFLATQ